uniref:KH domain-containing protein n=1 Tax=Caenorhabditis tropicalis TaxID=1561998 RepID=A0A1I7V316_9PELO
MGDEYSDDSKPSQQGVKRPQDAPDGPANEKAHFGQEEEGGDHLSIKILIPSSAVGAIIGKGGEAMRNLKNDNNCRVQMSKNSETYPGTSERICLVKGRLNNIMAVIESIQDKIREKCADQAGSDAFDHKNTSRGSEIKIVMPNTSAGMVIGKSGANIKDIREHFGCQIQVYPKAGSVEAKTSLERVVTVAHEEAQALLQAASRVLEKVASDPHHSSEINKEDFGKAIGPNGSSNSGPSGGQSSNAPFSSTPAFNGGGGGGGMNVGSAGFGGQGGGGYGGQGQFGGGPQFGNGNPNSKYPMNGLGNNELLSFLDNLQSTLRTSGFNEQSVSEVMQAMQVLAKYNIMGLGLGLGVAAMAQMRTGQEGQMPTNHGSAGFGDGYGQGGQGGQGGGGQGDQVRRLLDLMDGSGNGRERGDNVLREKRQAVRRKRY